jgi:hypothetical protein
VLIDQGSQYMDLNWGHFNPYTCSIFIAFSFLLLFFIRKEISSLSEV